MSPKKVLLFLILAATALTALLSAGRAAAQEQQPFDLTVSPQYFDIAVDPGGDVKKTFRIRNNGTAPVDLKVEIKKLTTKNAGEVVVEDPGKNDDFANWITLGKDPNFQALPREWTDVSFEIKVPSTAAFGYYFAFLISPKASVTQSNVPAAKLTGAIAIPVLMNVKKSGAVTRGLIKEFKTDKLVYEYLPINFETTFENQGNVHIIPQGNIFITDWLGKQVGVINVNEANGAILPQSQRTFTSSWSDSFIYWEPKTENGKALTDRNGKAVQDLKIRWDKILDLRIGKYTASELLVVSGETRDTTYEAKITFTVFPWKIVLGALAVALFALVGIYSIVRTIVKKVKSIFSKNKKQ